MKKLATICSVVLVLVLAVSLAASCTGSGSNNTTTSTTKATTTTSTTTTTTPTTTKTTTPTTTTSTTPTTTKTTTPTTTTSTTPTTTKTTTPTTTTSTTTTTTTPTSTTTTTTTSTTTTSTTTTATGPKLDFTAATYTDTTYKFTFKYNISWTGTWSSDTNPISYGDATYSDPSVRIYVVPASLGTVLGDVLKSSDMLKQYNSTTPPTAPAIDGTGADMTNTYGTTATPVTFHFTWTDGTTGQSKAYGFVKGDKWFIMMLTISSGWNMKVDSIYPDEVFSTWQFN